MLRVKVFAAAIDMIAAGTNAPIATAANAMPANQAGNESSNNCGITNCALGLPSSPIGFVPAAIATQPSSASRPRTKEYAGRIDAFRRIVFRLLADSVAVIECGYMNNAIADPSASVAYGQYCAAPGMKAPAGFPVAGFGVVIFCSAAPKICAQPPNF